MSQTPILQRVTVRGAEIHYQEQGEGDPLVLIHGSLGDFRSWSLQVPVFSTRYRVITYSRRYHHPNAWTGDGSDYSADTHAEDLAAFIEQLGLDRVRIVSASYGSYCALVFAQRHPDRVKALVVAEPPILGWLRELPGGEELVTPFLQEAFYPSREAFLRGEDEAAIRLFIDGVVGRKGTFDGLHAPIRQLLLDNSREMKAECLSDRLFPHFGCEDARHIGAPILLLTGERSPKFFHRITDELERCLPHTRKVVIPGASHNLNSAAPRVYNQIVLGFLESSEFPASENPD